MNPQTPQPEPQPPPQQEPQQPPIEVQAEPAAPDDRGRVFDAPPPPAGDAGSGAASATAARRPAPWPMLCHLVGLIDLGLSVFGLGLIASTVVWLMNKDTDPEVDFHGKEAINFQLNQLVWMIAAVPLILACGLGLVVLVVAPIAKLALMTVAAIRAASGERWRYPLVYRVVE